MGKEACRPVWWPEEVELTKQPATTSGRFNFNNAFIQKLESTTAPSRGWHHSKWFCSQSCDSHSCIIDTSFCFYFWSSLICPWSFCKPHLPSCSFINTCSVTISISDPPFATPEGHVQPSLVFEDIVERKFGSESVYCGNMWQSVLQTCSELNQIQTSKMLSILGKLNEDVSFLLLIELLLFIHYFFVHVCVTNK